MALIFALFSLICATGNDLIYRRRSHGTGRDAGRHLLLVALVWSAVFLGPALIAGPISMAAVLWGSISGIAGVVAHLLLLGALRHGSLGTCSTIYRLNLIPATLVAVAVLGEELTPIKALAISVAMGAIALLGKVGGSTSGAIRLAVGACLLRAGMALGYKQGLLGGADSMHLLAVNGVAWCAGAALWIHLAPPTTATATTPSTSPWSRAAIGWGLASGLLVSGNVLFLMLALARAPLTTVLPLSQLSFVATTAIACTMGGESASLRQMAGIGLAATAVVLMAVT